MPLLQDVLSPLGTPTWQPIPIDRLATRPYSAVGRIALLRNGAEMGQGTGWLASERVVVTAAHVVLASQTISSLQVVFPGAPPEEPEQVVVHTKYGHSNGPYDPWDIAVLRLSVKNRTYLSRSSVGQGNIEVAGFPYLGDGQMTSSTGMCVIPDSAVILHQADTVPGHSGAPILQRSVGDELLVVGMHVWGFLGNPYKTQYSGHNLALNFTAEINAFIDAAVKN